MATTQNEKTKGDQVHLVLEGKGGVGKSLISAILGQYFQHRKTAPHCFDTSPVNHRGQRRRHNLRASVELHSRERHPELPGRSLAASLRSLRRDRRAGHGGYSERLFNRLAETITQKNVIVWLNEYFGEISRDGKSFEDFRVADEQASKLLGTVVILERNPKTYGDDMRQMLSKRLTFEEAIRLAEFSLVSKQRLTIIRLVLEESLEAIRAVVVEDLVQFKQTAQWAHSRAESTIQSEVRLSARALREELQSDIDTARLRATIVEEVKQTYEMPLAWRDLIIWTLTILLALLVGFAMGRLHIR